MACERWREMVSAQLDGEDDPADRPLVEQHLAGCVACRDWLDQAATVNRLTRTGPVAEVPDLTAAILAALPPAPVPKRRLPLALYVALAAVGAVQLILGLAQVTAQPAPALRLVPRGPMTARHEERRVA